LRTSYSDATFEAGTGSWTGAVNASVSLGSAYAHSGEFSLAVTPTGAGSYSAITGKYNVPGGAAVNGALWVLTPTGIGSVTATLTFYSSTNAIVGTLLGTVTTSSTSSWTQVAVSGTAPSNAATVAIGFSNSGGAGPTYADDASLFGATQFAYT
jgi:hypothetical protein